MAIVAPSILTADFGRLGEELAAVAEAPLLHLDVMDGHFVPALTFGLPVVEACRRAFPGALEAHLMVANPDERVEEMVAAGAARVFVHVEAAPDARGLLARIRRLGAEAGLALNPATPLERIEPHLDVADAVLVMTVVAGRGGQPFQSAPLEKVRRLRRLGYTGLIGVDGGINAATAPLAVAAGADVLVAGSAIFDGGDAKANLRRLEAAVAAASGGT